MEEVESPCVGVCKTKDSVCIGCGRTLYEISYWRYMNNVEKKDVLKRIDEDIISSGLRDNA